MPPSAAPNLYTWLTNEIKRWIFDAGEPPEALLSYCHSVAAISKQDSKGSSVTLALFSRLVIHVYVFLYFCLDYTRCVANTNR